MTGLLFRPFVSLTSVVLQRWAARRPQLVHHDDEIAHYATRTYRGGQLVAETPEITYGELRAAAPTEPPSAPCTFNAR